MNKRMIGKLETWMNKVFTEGFMCEDDEFYSRDFTYNGRSLLVKVIPANWWEIWEDDKLIFEGPDDRNFIQVLSRELFENDYFGVAG